MNKTTEEIQQWLVEHIAELLVEQPQKINLEVPITSLGISSREAIMLSGTLEEWLGFELPPELLYEYPEIPLLAEKLAQGPEAFAKAKIPPTRSVPREGKDEPAYASYIDLVQARVREIPDRDTFIFLRDGENEEARITMSGLDLRARAIAAYLQQRVAEGERVILIYPNGIDFITGFLGCLYAKVIAVPAYPPTQARGADRLDAISNDSGTRLALSTRAELDSLLVNKKGSKDAFLNKVELLATDEIPDDMAGQWRAPRVDHNTVAFLQYTSGSTGSPKGVMVTHGNILHNLKSIRESFDMPEHHFAAGWLPMFHDMGLIGDVLSTINTGCTQVSMPPTAFLQKPARWLRAISKYKASYNSAPNFAFDHCVDKIDDDELQGVDLSSWQVTCNGSEPVREETIERFTKRFAPYGFRRRVFCPSYGMAETTLLISTGNTLEEPKILFLDGPSLENNKVLFSDPGLNTTMSKVSCGYVRFGKLLVVNPETFEKLPDNQVGEIWFSSESVSPGYWNKPDVNELTFNAFTSNTGEGPFLRTGDLGFTRKGEVFITGRLKDLLIIRGRNHYPQDIEATIQNADTTLAVNGGAAFTLDAFGEERLVIVQEVKRSSMRDLNPETVFDNIRAAVAEEHTIQVYAITLLSPGRLPRTTSGKIQRRATKKAFLDDSLAKIADWKLELTELERSEETKTPALSLPALRNAPVAERIPLIEDYLLRMVARTLRTSASQVDVNKPVINLGMDSMHAIEIKNRIESDLGLELPVTQLMEGISIRELAQASAGRLDELRERNTANVPAAGETNGIDAAQARELLSNIDNMTPEEVQELLTKLGSVQ